MRRPKRVQVILSLAAVTVLALSGAPGTARAQVCGPGSHWVEGCPGGIDTFWAVGEMTVTLFGLGTFTLETYDQTTVWRGDPLDQYVHPIEGTIGADDGHMDVIPTELGLLRGLTRGTVGGVHLQYRAGDGIPNGTRDNELYSPGAIDEYPPTIAGCPTPFPSVPPDAQACSFFDVFFEILNSPFGPLRNDGPAFVIGEQPLCQISAVPYACPRQAGAVGGELRYIKVGGGFVLVDAAGVPRGEVLFFSHTPTPEPGTVALLATGLAGVAGVARQRRRRRPTGTATDRMA